MRLQFVVLAGCLSLPGAAKVTYHKDVLPVLQKSCQGCHRPGEPAPMTFMSYKETRPWAKAIKQAVQTRKMPPWFADRAVGHFSNDRSLSDAEIATLTAWADTGATEGNAKDAPAPVAFINGWNIGKPDVEIEMPAEFAVPASGTIDYQYFVIPTGFTEDKWVRAAEVRPGNRAVVHHVIAFVREPGSRWLQGARPGVPFVPSRRKDNSGGERRSEGGQGEFLVGYAPGSMPEMLAPGRAKLIKAGSDIVFQMHYTANGKEHTDRSKIGLTFAKEPPRERVMTLAVGTDKFVIPPGAGNHRVDATLAIHGSGEMFGLLPHMHLRGKSFEYRLVHPDGRRETLLNVPRYDFNWQLSYYPARPIMLGPGMVLEATAHFDNSANNPANPDAKAEVRFGDQSWEEMMLGFFNIAFDAKLNPMEILRPRQAGPSSGE